jgi:hypothetical protein
VGSTSSNKCLRLDGSLKILDSTFTPRRWPYPVLRFLLTVSGGESFLAGRSCGRLLLRPVASLRFLISSDIGELLSDLCASVRVLVRLSVGLGRVASVGLLVALRCSDWSTSAAATVGILVLRSLLILPAISSVFIFVDASAFVLDALDVLRGLSTSSVAPTASPSSLGVSTLLLVHSDQVVETLVLHFGVHLFKLCLP